MKILVRRLRKVKTAEGSKICFDMREHMSDIYLLPIEMHRSTQAILVAANIKCDEIADLISRRKDCLQVLKTAELTLAHNFEPLRTVRF